MDWGEKEVYIENTLPGQAYWTLSFREFVDVWHNPEQEADRIPNDVTPQRVNYWAAFITPRSR